MIGAEFRKSCSEVAAAELKRGFGCVMRGLEGDMRGWVYVLSNQGMPGLLKVGRTAEHPRTRAAQLHTTGVPTPFQVEYAVRVDCCDRVERTVHHELRSHRMDRRREFFTIELSAVVRAMENAVSTLHLDVLDVVDPAKERARAREQAQQEQRERERVEHELKRRKRIEGEAQMLIGKAHEPVQAATDKIERALHLAWAGLVGLLVILAFTAIGSFRLWPIAVACFVYFPGRLILMLPAGLIVSRTRWGRAVLEVERATLEAIAQRREQALRSPVVESIIAS
ncbi:GIY-YIG nuclease family protein [Phenylobacterium sp. 58.2.17]|uniref:GIY-YIG nuclease family protein n=1 Tax=Phenylobacterium sp. 58.2.17 TaxID=2969306 RepID=UPI0022650EDB|nr:GIY-YIG nuclease family protein [Phenylobacterium sp. 58.2.17]MCX7584885.1 GIY-YIG nuclease family protein [Phenylobacterium sp. 58.2.17]